MCAHQNSIQYQLFTYGRSKTGKGHHSVSDKCPKIQVTVKQSSLHPRLMSRCARPPKTTRRRGKALMSRLRGESQLRHAPAAPRSRERSAFPSGLFAPRRQRGTASAINSTHARPLSRSRSLSVGRGPRHGGARSVGRNVCCDGLAGGIGTDPMVRTDLDSCDPNCSLRNS